ncbi:MAG: methyltransferase [Vicinamibacterales bacterium]
MPFDPSSKNRLTPHDLGRFPSASLFDRLGRAVCTAGCLPRKELYEAWELARRVRRRFRGGRVVDVGGGHGLLAYAMLLLDRTSPGAVVVDPTPPPSAAALRESLRAVWPNLPPVTHTAAPLERFSVAPGDVVVSCHACGALTDRVLERAAEARARVAVLPCCHVVEHAQPPALAGWMDATLAIDARRAVALEQRGYTVWTAAIPAAITPKHRVLMGAPAGPAR